MNHQTCLGVKKCIFDLSFSDPYEAKEISPNVALVTIPAIRDAFGGEPLNCGFRSREERIVCRLGWFVWLGEFMLRKGTVEARGSF